MKKIGLLSDTHGMLLPSVLDFFKNCNEVWHAGDIGSIAVANSLETEHTFKAVYGNIDGYDIRSRYPEYLVIKIERLKVLMIHIGGYPGKYTKQAKQLIETEKPGLFISGHSHILKVMPDKKNGLLHINPGSAGKQGLHQKITCIRFNINKGKITELEVFEKERY